LQINLRQRHLQRKHLKVMKSREFALTAIPYARPEAQPALYADCKHCSLNSNHRRCFL
jgi:hypothetical protein